MGKWLTVEQKYELILKHRRSPGLSQVKLARWAAASFNMERVPSANTVKKILQAAESIELKHRQGITKRGRDVASPELEAALKAFVDASEAAGARLSRKLLVQKAQEILAQLPPERRPNLGLSVGWMTNFMARHGLRFRQFRRRRADGAAETPGAPQRTLTDVTDHLALARDTAGRQAVMVDAVMQVDTVAVADTVEETERKTVLVTGASGGIGLAFVQHYVSDGWNVIAAVRDLDKAERFNLYKVVTLDVADEQSIQDMARELDGEPIDLLVNNAGMTGLYGLDDTTAGDCVRQFQVNALGPLLVTRALLPNLQLAASARGSAFVAQVTSRIGSISDNSSGGAYAHRASKGALNVITKSLAIDLEPHNIGCLLLHPGNVNTAYSNFKGAIEPKESVDGMTKLIARTKVGDPLQLLHFGKGDVIDW
ncbi:unnamed protein product [Phytophthora lilii]|uniref:Unnamed protein product n=1 Tax=Phytophthora lilii TaxID=2077276 RepID=A0A9W6TX10_9STRA|nr:unnamed protein product [Phytophthora lilii]